MIDHSNCDHPRTPSARAKCRRQQRGGEPPKKQKTASVKEVNFGSDGKASTPGFKELECDNCGVERVTMRGTDPLSGMILTVGERCSYLLKQSKDLVPLD